MLMLTLMLMLMLLRPPLEISIVSAAPVVLVPAIFVGVNKSEKLRMNLSGS